MKRWFLIVLFVPIAVSGNLLAAEDPQWVRVTALLETGSGFVQRAEESLVPGGVYSLDEVGRRGIDAIDWEIVHRVDFLAESMSNAEESMRLATLMARQYYLALEVGRKAVLPVIDLNPRLGIVLTPLRFEDNRAVCRVQFLEPEGSPGDPDFTGEPMTLHLKDADLQKVLLVFSQITEIPIDIDPTIEGSVTVDLRDVPWDQALDLVLRINDLGWYRENGTLKVVPLDELSRRKRVRTEATIKLPRGTWGSASIASRGDDENPTVVLLVESVDGPPAMVAEQDGLVHPNRIQLVVPSTDEAKRWAGGLAIFRAFVTEDGRLRDIHILSTPAHEYSDRLVEKASSWLFRSVLDEEGRKHQAVVGYGVRILPPRVLASFGAVEHIGVAVSAGPAPNDPQVYVVSAEVVDLDSGEVIAMPRVSTLRGDEARVRTGFQSPSGEPTMLEMSFLVSEDGDHVSYSWRLTRDDTVVSEHKAEIGL